MQKKAAIGEIAACTQAPGSRPDAAPRWNLHGLAAVGNGQAACGFSVVCAAGAAAGAGADADADLAAGAFAAFFAPPLDFFAAFLAPPLDFFAVAFFAVVFLAAFFFAGIPVTSLPLKMSASRPGPLEQPPLAAG